MADGRANDEPGRARQYRYLPYLTSALLAVLCVWFVVWFAFYRATTAERLQVMSLTRALRHIPDVYVTEVEREDLYRGAMRGMVAALEDRYSAYLSADDARTVGEDVRGEFGGIGVVLSAAADQALIEEVLPDGPAAAAGIEAGDVITHVDGDDMRGLPLEDLVPRVRGEVGSEVELTLERPATGEVTTRTVRRDIIRAPNVTWEMLEDGIALLHVRTFDQRCADEVRQALHDMRGQGMRGLLIDLRGNRGGLIGQAEQISDMFLEEGLILSLVGRTVESEPPVDATAGVEVPADVPVVVMVDRGTASAAEILAGALQAHGRAGVVGTGTVGKGVVTTVIPLPDGSGVNLTIAHYRLADGTVIEGNGIEPDVVAGEMPPPPKDMDRAKMREWFLAERGKARAEQFERAVELLKEKLRASGG